MKRMHLHVAVDDLAKNIVFYSRMFGCAPSVEKADYAKWMLDDPRVNFAISARGLKPGLDHMGIQTDTDAELAAMKQQFDAAGLESVSQIGTTCCYAESDKHWLADPQGIAWETYHTLADAPTFGSAERSTNSACCAPAAQTVQMLFRKKPEATRE